MTTLPLIRFWLFLIQNTRIGIASGAVPGAGRCARCGLGRAVRRGGASRPLDACAVRLLLRSAGAHACGAIVDLVLCSPGSGRHAALGAAHGAALWQRLAGACKKTKKARLVPVLTAAETVRRLQTTDRFTDD